MLIAAGRTVALRCPACGKLNKRRLGLFDFSGKRRLKIDCSCGYALLEFRRRERRDYLVQIPCVICEVPHLINLRKEHLWQTPLLHLTCPETQVELAFIGEENLVLKALDESKIPLEDILSEIDYDEFFEAPDVMWEVLQRLQEMASLGSLSCECGNPHIEIDIFPNKVELRCPQCEGRAVIYGEREDDARIIRETERVELVPGTATYLDHTRIPSSHHKS